MVGIASVSSWRTRQQILREALKCQFCCSSTLKVPLCFLLLSEIYSIWYEAFVFWKKKSFNSPVCTPTPDAGLSFQWMRDVVTHSMIMSSLTLLTRIFPVHYPLPLFSSNILSADGLSLTLQHLEKYDIERSGNVLRRLGTPQGLTERLAY